MESWRSVDSENGMDLFPTPNISWEKCDWKKSSNFKVGVFKMKIGKNADFGAQIWIGPKKAIFGKLIEFLIMLPKHHSYFSDK